MQNWRTLLMLLAVLTLAGCGGGTEAPPEPAPKPPPPPAEPKLEGPGQIKLPNLISSHMVLQANQPVRLWGHDEPGQRVTAEINGQRAEATAGEDGNWEVTLPKLEAGGPHLLEITGTGRIVIQDVLVGEVWLASGQSNMEWHLAKTQDAKQDVPQANHPGIRLFLVKKGTAENPVDDVQGQWVLCTPETAAGFSAVAYYFALELQREMDTPVGLIGSYWGGTAVQPWSPEAALQKTEPGKEALVRKAEWWNEEKRQAGFAKLNEWVKENSPTDEGNKGEALGYAQPSLNTADWKVWQQPRAWEWDGVKANGAVWFRREVDVPDAWAGKDLEVQLGTWGDDLIAYWNGQPVKQTGFEDKGIRNHRYVFTVPGAEVGGPAVLAVRLFDRSFEGGLHGPLILKPVDEKVGMNLDGKWQVKMAQTTPPLSREVRRTKPFVPGFQSLGASLYNAMIDPVVPYTIAGVIWYQGESNAHQAKAYLELFPAMIEGWRESWGQGDFPFYYVQLANFRQRYDHPTESKWAELRESQRLTEDRVKNTGMALAIDIGDANDIHPRNKKEVGRRLALLARARTYGQAGVKDSGPAATAADAGKDGQVTVKFAHALGLRTTDGGPPKGFALAGEDKQFQWAEAKIDGGSVVLKAADVPQPRWVRYGWAYNPEVNLVNQADLPAVPFELAVKGGAPTTGPAAPQ